MGDKKSHKNCKHCGNEVRKDMYREWYHVEYNAYLCPVKGNTTKVADWP
jgi:hypothetical protein